MIKELTAKDRRLLKLQLKLDKAFEKSKQDPQYTKTHMMELSEN